MARHRVHHGLTFSRARHRAPGPIQRVVEGGIRSALVAAAAAMLVMAMLGTDPIAGSRS